MSETPDERAYQGAARSGGFAGPLREEGRCTTCGLSQSPEGHAHLTGMALPARAIPARTLHRGDVLVYSYAQRAIISDEPVTTGKTTRFHIVYLEHTSRQYQWRTTGHAPSAVSKRADTLVPYVVRASPATIALLEDGDDRNEQEQADLIATVASAPPFVSAERDWDERTSEQRAALIKELGFGSDDLPEGVEIENVKLGNLSPDLLDALEGRAEQIRLRQNWGAP